MGKIRRNGYINKSAILLYSRMIFEGIVKHPNYRGELPQKKVYEYKKDEIISVINLMRRLSGNSSLKYDYDLMIKEYKFIIDDIKRKKSIFFRKEDIKKV